MSTVLVSNPAALLAALKSAVSGGVILLAPGPWPAVAIYDYHAPAGGVVSIQSQNPLNPAALPALTINISSGLSFSNLTFATTAANPVSNTRAPTPFVIYSSQRITLSRLSVHGTLDNNPQDDVNCLRFQGSDQVSVLNSEFQQCYNAITELNNTHVTISGNSIHDIRNDGIDNGGSSDVTISGNHFTNFHPYGAVGSTGDHADAIQFWTTNTAAPAHDIAITGNSFVRGTGHWIQGIFVTDGLGLLYQRLTITGNVILGGEYNGIAVGGCSGATIGGNTVQPYLDMPSWILVDQCLGAGVTDNRAGAYYFTNDVGLSQTSNAVLASIAAPGQSPGGAARPVAAASRP